VFKVRQEKFPTGTPPKPTTHVMKTKSIATLLTAALTIAFAASASAAPAGKRFGPSKTSASSHTNSTPVAHDSMHRVGPPGKGYICKS
jgi:hypothetical protein